MQETRELMMQSTSLIETILEALVHAKKQIISGDYESSIPLFTDVIHAFQQVEMALESLDEGIISSEAAGLEQQIRLGLESTVDAYEFGLYQKVKDLLDSSLILDFSAWHSQLSRDFSRYLLH